MSSAFTFRYEPEHVELLTEIRNYIPEHRARFEKAREWLLSGFGPDRDGVCPPDREAHSQRQKQLTDRRGPENVTSQARKTAN